MTSLRFAALTRVSDKSQAKERKTSLQEQATAIGSAVARLGGEITRWYRGQEHATPNYERKLLDQLMDDSASVLFDAVMVMEPSRWSRDNGRSKPDLEKLKANKIRFFTSIREYNLFNPQDRYELGMTTESNQFFAEMQQWKMLTGKIAGAKKGILTVGSKPFARIYSKKNGWGIDEIKQRKIKKAIRLYLNGENFEVAAKVAGMSKNSLWYTFTHGLGGKWPLHFKSKKFNVDEEVILDIPRLVPLEVEMAVKKRLESNKIFTHGKYKYLYLLSRRIFCGRCGRTLGALTVQGYRYYRHNRHANCIFSSIKADLIDEVVVREVYSLFGDARAREEAIKAASGDRSRLKELDEEIGYLEGELEGINKEKDRIINHIRKATLTDEEVEGAMRDIRGREALLKEKIGISKGEREQMLTDEEIKEISGDIKREVLGGQLEHSWLGSGKHLEEMSMEQKKAMLDIVFANKIMDAGVERRPGVYIRKEGDRWIYTIRGNFPIIKGSFKVGLSNQIQINA